MLGKSTQERELILGNVTRWTEDYHVLERVLLFRHAIDFHIHQVIRVDPCLSISKDDLSATDWHILELIFNFLRPFKKETLALKGHRLQGSLYDIVPSMKLL